MPLGGRRPDCLLPHERGEDCGQAEVLMLMTSQTIFYSLDAFFSAPLYRQSAGGGTSVFRAANLFSGLAVLAMLTIFNQKSCV